MNLIFRTIALCLLATGLLSAQDIPVSEKENQASLHVRSVTTYFSGSEDDTTAKEGRLLNRMDYGHDGKPEQQYYVMENGNVSLAYTTWYTYNIQRELIMQTVLREVLKADENFYKHNTGELLYTTTVFNYDTTGKMILKTEFFPATATAADDSIKRIIEYEYRDSLLIEVRRDSYDDSEDFVKVHEYDSEGKLILTTMTLPARPDLLQVLEYSYENGLLKEKKERLYNNHYIKFVYTYDSSGKLMEEWTFDENDNGKKTISYNYNTDGLLTEQVRSLPSYTSSDEGVTDKAAFRYYPNGLLQSELRKTSESTVLYVKKYEFY